MHDGVYEKVENAKVTESIPSLEEEIRFLRELVKCRDVQIDELKDTIVGLAKRLTGQD